MRKYGYQIHAYVYKILEYLFRSLQWLLGAEPQGVASKNPNCCQRFSYWFLGLFSRRGLGQGTLVGLLERIQACYFLPNPSFLRRYRISLQIREYLSLHLLHLSHPLRLRNARTLVFPCLLRQR